MSGLLRQALLQISLPQDELQRYKRYRSVFADADADADAATRAGRSAKLSYALKF